jgi:hypothetical protein
MHLYSFMERSVGWLALVVVFRAFCWADKRLACLLLLRASTLVPLLVDQVGKHSHY